MKHEEPSEQTREEVVTRWEERVEQDVEELVPTPWRRVRPLWRTVALTVATINLYWFYWFWATWREVKQETGDNRMRPFGHMLSLFVPIYQLFRIHAHFRAIRDLVVQRSEVKGVGLVLLSPGIALVLALVAGFLVRLSADLSFKPAYAGSPWYESGLLVLGTLLGFHASPGGLWQGSFHLGFDFNVNEFVIAFPFHFSIDPGLSLVVFLASIAVFATLIWSAQQALNSLWLSTSGTVTTGTRWYHWLVLVLGAGSWFLLLSTMFT